MPFVDDMMQALQIQIDAFWYEILLLAAGLHWGALRAVLLAGYTVELVNRWLTEQAFAPLVAQTAAGLETAFSLTFVVALFVLGVTYALAAFVRLDVVAPRSALLWYLAGGLFFGAGPALYTGMNTLRTDAAAALYTATLGGLQSTSGGAFASLSGVTSDGVGMLTPCDNFGPYLGTAGGVDGLDVALAYLRADGVDVMGYGSTCTFHYPTTDGQVVGPVPTEWERPGSFFDNTLEATFYPILTDEERAVSVRLAGAAHGRLLTAWPLVLFGVAEQAVALLLTVAQGLTFVSFAVAVLFAFFKRTEIIARSVVDQWIELLIQTVLIAVVQALVAAFFLAGAATGSGVVVLGVGLLCLVFVLIVLWSGVKAVWNSFNRLFAAVGQVTGGAVVSPGGVAAAVGAAAVGGAALAAGGGSSALAGMRALNTGATPAQAAGLALGGSSALSGAARTLAYLPGVRGTSLGDAAEQFAEGSVTRTVAERLPVVGRVAAPVVGAALLTNRDPDAAAYDEAGHVLSRPMLVPAVGEGLERITTPLGARRGTPPARSEYLEDEDGELLPLDRRPSRTGAFTPDAPRRERERSEYGADMRGEELEQHLTETAQANSRFLTGALRVSGEADVASVMGDVLRLSSDRAGGLDHLTVAERMAAAVGVTPMADHPPVTQDLARFGLFLNSALRAGLSPDGAARVVREVAASPEGALPPSSRESLTSAVRERQGLSWVDARRRVGELERGAALLPNAITVRGQVAAPPVTVNVAVSGGDRPSDSRERAASKEATVGGSGRMLGGDNT